MVAAIVNDTDIPLELVRDGVQAVGTNAAISGTVKAITYLPKGLSAAKGKILSKGAQEAAEAGATKAAQKMTEEAARRAATELGKKAAGEGLVATVGWLPVVGTVVGIGMETYTFYDELCKISKYCENSGKEMGFTTVLFDSEVRGAAMEKLGDYIINSAVNLTGIIPIPGVNAAADFAISMSIKSAQIYRDIANPDAIQLVNELQDQLDNPEGAISLKRLGLAVEKIAEVHDPKLLKELVTMRESRDPAYAEAMMSLAQGMQRNGNAAGTINFMVQSGEMKCTLENCKELVGKKHGLNIQKNQQLTEATAKTKQTLAENADLHAMGSQLGLHGISQKKYSTLHRAEVAPDPKLRDARHEPGALAVSPAPAKAMAEIEAGEAKEKKGGMSRSTKLALGVGATIAAGAILRKTDVGQKIVHKTGDLAASMQDAFRNVKATDVQDVTKPATKLLTGTPQVSAARA